jgi:hypothetical protein
MKVIALTLLALASAASAVSITLIEDSATRLDFSVHWDPTGADVEVGDSPALTKQLPGVNGFVGIAVAFNWIWGPPGPPAGANLFIEVSTGFPFDRGALAFPDEFDRTFSSATVSLFAKAASVTGVADSPYAVRVVYDAQVPDTGGTLMLLAGAIGVLGALRRFGWR